MEGGDVKTGSRAKMKLLKPILAKPKMIRRSL